MPNASAAQAAEAFGRIYRFKKRGREKANELKLRAAKRAEAGFRFNLCAAHGTEFTGRFRFRSGFAIADGSFFIGQQAQRVLRALRAPPVQLRSRGTRARQLPQELLLAR